MESGARSGCNSIVTRSGPGGQLPNISLKKRAMAAWESVLAQLG
jgi:hypothetical protein